jgi:Fe-S cluster biosynthesis and repair protein YggX
MNESRKVFCAKLKKEGEGLSRPPMASPLGERIYQEISKEAWTLWIKHQTKLINEGPLNLTDPATRQFLVTEMEKFFFGD